MTWSSGWSNFIIEWNFKNVAYGTHRKPWQVEAAYIECGNGAAAMQVSQVNLFELGPTCFKSIDLLALPQHCSRIQFKLVQLFWIYSVYSAEPIVLGYVL